MKVDLQWQALKSQSTRLVLLCFLVLWPSLYLGLGLKCQAPGAVRQTVCLYMLLRQLHQAGHPYEHGPKGGDRQRAAHEGRLGGGDGGLQEPEIEEAKHMESLTSMCLCLSW